MDIGHVIAVFFGLTNASGPWYLGWSGAGSDIQELAVFGLIFSMYRRHNCGVAGCWRLGARKVPGTEHVVCNRHNPSKKLTHAQILEEHAGVLANLKKKLEEKL